MIALHPRIIIGARRYLLSVTKHNEMLASTIQGSNIIFPV